MRHCHTNIVAPVCRSPAGWTYQDCSSYLALGRECRDHCDNTPAPQIKQRSLEHLRAELAQVAHESKVWALAGNLQRAESSEQCEIIAGVINIRGKHNV